MLLGILCGFGGAVGQDAGYILTRRYVRSGRTPGELLIHSQLQLGAWSVLLLVLLLIFCGLPHSNEFWLPLCGAVVGSGGGQYFFFRAEQKMDPARVSSLMGLRVVLVVLLSFFVFGEHFSCGQWFGVILAALSAPLLNYEGGVFRTGGLGSLAAALGFYAVSDQCIGRMVHGLGFSSPFTGAVYALAVLNLASSLILLPFAGRKAFQKAEFAAALPFAGSWIVKQFLLYSCYALIGPVHGNVVLSFRGPIAIVLALIFPDGEAQVSKGVWLQRIGATLLMTAALLCYTLF